MVQQWIHDNPGCQVLPRTLVNRVESATGEALQADKHGEHRFSEEDLEFLKARRGAEAPADRPVPDPEIGPPHDHREATDL